MLNTSMIIHYVLMFTVFVLLDIAFSVKTTGTSFYSWRRMLRAALVVGVLFYYHWICNRWPLF